MLLSKPIESLQELNLSGMFFSLSLPLGNALTDDGFIAIMDILIAGALPNLIYINVDGMLVINPLILPRQQIDRKVHAVFEESVRVKEVWKASSSLSQLYITLFLFIF